MSVTSVSAASRSPTPVMLAHERVTAAVPTIVLETPAGQRPVIALATFRIRGSSRLSAPGWCKAAPYALRSSSASQSCRTAAWTCETPTAARWLRRGA